MPSQISIDAETTNHILDLLKNIEKQHGVIILFAAEAGSRAWGFPSKDSDYDVRFVYIHPRDHYLSLHIETKRDTLEWMSEDRMFDLSGWDVRKSLVLMEKSNPSLFEWLYSPIVYLKRNYAFDQLKFAVDKTYNRVASHYHYMSMAKNNFRRWLVTENVRFKKYLYVLRPLMAVDYISTHETPPPVNYFDLIEQCSVPNDVKTRVLDLIRRKANAEELDDMPRDEVLHEYISKMLDWEKPYYDIPPKMSLETTFRNLLDEFSG